MDASQLLAAVAQAYESLESLSAAIVCVNESGDEESFNRSEQRSKAYYQKPDKVRMEQGGARGTVYVSDGAFFHNYFSHAKRYSKHPFVRRDFLPGWFRAEHPLVGGIPEFLFHQINDRVVSAEVLPEPTGGVEALLVAYEPSPTSALFSCSPVTYWIDSRTHLVLRAEAEVSHRRPASDETTTHKKIVEIARWESNAALAPDLFEYSPPPGAEDASVPPGRGRISIGGGGGGALVHPDKSKSMESWHHSEWIGDTLVEQLKLRLRGLDLIFERRLTFSEDGRELRIVERIAGPEGQTEGEFTIPVRKTTAEIE